MRDDQPRAEPLGLAAEQLDMPRRPLIGFERPSELLFDSGAEDFDRDVATGSLCGWLLSGASLRQLCRCSNEYTEDNAIYLHFYSVDHDYRELCRKISGRVPMYFMTGVYDFACTPEMTQQTADKIKNSECIIMQDIGHFPMSENPELFKEYLMPVLKKIVQSDREAGRSTERAGRDAGRDNNRDMSRDEPGRSAERASQGRANGGVESPSYRSPTPAGTDRGSVRVLDVDAGRGSRARR